MGSQESTDLVSQLVVLGRTEEPAVGHGLEHVQLGINPACTKLPVHPNGIGQKQVSGSRLQKGRREGGAEVTEQWRQIGVSEIVVTGIQGDGVGQDSRSTRCRCPGLFGMSRRTRSGRLRASAG